MDEEEENPDEVLHNTDGLVWGLYSHLWRKTHRGQPCPNINLPHTVVYKNARPIAWYFTSLKDNQIYRKQRRKVVGQFIWDAMSAGQEPDVDACAWFSGNMTLLASQPKKTKGFQQKDEQYELHPTEETKEAASFEYLPSERVHHLTYPGQYTVVLEQIYDGILQKFVAPREAHDSIIRAIWSPTACVCERRTNRNVLSDQTKPLTSRIASFEHANFWLNSHQVLPEGSVVVERLTSQCEAVVDHLRDTTSGKVSVARMELYFKLDAHNRIWLMYCNTLRLDPTVYAIDRSPSMQREMPHRQYSLRDPTRHDDSTRITWDDNPFMCALTGKTCSGRQRMDVSYKLLIQSWFKEVAELANENDRIGALDNIPPAIRRANPNITRDYYLRMRSQPVFLMKTAPVSADAAAALIPAVASDLARTIARPTAELAKSAGGAALAEPMPIITAAHARDPSSLSFHRQQRGVGQRRDIPSSVRLVACSKEADNGLLYQPGAVLPEALMPRPKTPPTMVPVYASGPAHRIPATMSRTARLTASTSSVLQPSGSPGGTGVWAGAPQHRLYSTGPAQSGIVAAPPAPPSLAPAAPAAATQGSLVPTGAGGAGLGVPVGTNRSQLRARSPTGVGQPAALKSSAPKPLFAAKPRAVPLHEPRKSQHSPGRVQLEAAAEAELMAQCSSTYIAPHQGIVNYMPQVKKRSSARPGGPTLPREPASSKASPKSPDPKGEGKQSLQAMKDAYASAEATTQELLAQAQQILKEPGPSTKPSAAAPVSLASTNSNSTGHNGGSAAANGASPLGGGVQAGGQAGQRQNGGGEWDGGPPGAGGSSFTHDENELLTEALMEQSQ